MGVKEPLSSELVRYNPFTGKRIDLLKGEIEWVENISPDGLYAVVVTDDNGCFEAYPSYDPKDDPLESLPTCESNRESKPQHVVVDLKTGDTLYEQPAKWTFKRDRDYWHFCYDNDSKSIGSNCVSSLSAGPVDSWMLIDDRLLIQVDGPWSDGAKSQYTLIDLRGARPQKQVLGQLYGLRYLPVSQQFFIFLDSSSLNAEAIKLFDLATGKSTPFIRPTSSDQYWMLIGEDTADTITVTVSAPYKQWVNGQPDSVEQYIYTVRFPKTNS